MLHYQMDYYTKLWLKISLFTNVVLKRCVLILGNDASILKLIRSVLRRHL